MIAVFQIALCVLDVLVCMDTFGPFKGEPVVPSGTIIVGCPNVTIA